MAPSGRRLARLPGPDIDLAPGVTVLHTGGVRIGATAFLGVPCISIGAAQCTPMLQGSLQIRATCAPRRIVFAFLLDARSTGLEVGTRDGRTVLARIVRLPAAGGHRRLAVAVLPAGAAPVRVVLRRGRSRAPERRALALPPAARQCGYAGATVLSQLGVSEPDIR
jgi:hypothetical protein